MDKRVHTFLKSIGLKVNIIAWLGFELSSTVTTMPVEHPHVHFYCDKVLLTAPTASLSYKKKKSITEVKIYKPIFFFCLWSVDAIFVIVLTNR